VRGLKRILVLSFAVAALVLPANALAGSSMFIGAVENAPLQWDPAAAQAKVDLARLAGFDALRITEFWGPGRASILPPSDLVMLQNAANAAQFDGIRLIVSVSNFDQRTTPRTQQYRDEFGIFVANLARALPSVTDFIIGNEPNLNLFWMPQFSKPVYGYKLQRVRVHGKLVTKRVKYVKKQPVDLAAPSYELLLAQTYDTLKQINPDINVIGVALSPRGGDAWDSIRQTHTPQTFIADLGKAYRNSGRTTPIMDAFAIHPYGENSKLPPTFAHPLNKNIGLADYSKLVKSLGQAFDGTGQPGSTLPIVYDEYGVQSRIPAAKKSIYSNLGTAPAQDVVSEATQGAYYRQAFQMAYCQPNVVGMLIFHVSDESDAKAWQSGVFYADDTPKSSLVAVRATAEAAANGTLASCPGLVDIRQVLAPDESSYSTENTTWRLSLTCGKWCSFIARVEQFPDGTPALETKGDSPPDQETTIAFPDQKLPPGTYRYSIRVYAYGKIGSTVLRASKPFKVQQPDSGPPPPGGTPPPGGPPPPPAPTTTPGPPTIPLPALPPLPPLPAPR
jgi:hypothetical protein